MRSGFLSKSLLLLTMTVSVYGCVAAVGCRPRTTSLPANAAGAARASGHQMVHLRLQLNWYPEVEHGGYYTAWLEGYFAEEGLDVEILPGSANTPVAQLVDTGRVELGVTNADQILLAQDAGAELVAIFAALQISPRCILVHEESGIRHWDELADVTLAVSSGATFFRYLTRHLPLRNVQIVAYSGNVAAFVANPRYAQQGYVFSEPYLAEKLGARPHVLMVSDLGYNPYTSILVARKAWVLDRPQLASRLLRACRRGWQKYLNDPEPTNQYIVSQNSELPLDVARYGATAIRPLCLPSSMSPDALGTMSHQRWEELTQQLRDAGLIQGADVESLVFSEALQPRAKP